MIKCSVCGSTKYLQKHHSLPLSEGGEDSFLNRVWLCFKCHLDTHKHGVGKPRKPKDTGWNAFYKHKHVRNVHVHVILDDSDYYRVMKVKKPLHLTWKELILKGLDAR